MKTLHLSDLHIREKDLDEIARCLNFIIETAKAESPDLAIIAGDIFDSRDVKLESRAAWTAISFIGTLADICPVAIVIGTPSHDGNSPAILQFVHGAYPVIVAEKPMQVALADHDFLQVPCGAIPDAVITLIPQPTKKYWQSQAGIAETDQEIGAAMSGMFCGFGASAAEYPGVPHILVYHGGISGAALPSGQVRTGMDIEVSTDQMMMANPDLGCLGHIHKAQQLGDRFFYSGPIYATKIDEQGPNGFYVHEIFPNCKGPIHPRFIHTPCKEYLRYTFDATKGEEACIPGGHFAGKNMRVELRAWQDEAEMIDLEKMAEELKHLGAESVDIRITRVPRKTVRAESVVKAESLREKIVKMEEIKGGSVDPAVLAMADLLQGTKADDLLRQAMSAGGGA